MPLRQEVDEGLAVFRDEGVEIYDLRNALRRAIGDTGRDHAAIAVAEQHDIAQLLAFEDANHVVDVGFEVVFRTRQMRALA